MTPISAVVLAKNAERYLAQVLSSLAAFDEVVLLDNGSTDNTARIAQTFPNVSYYRHDGFDGFGNMKNRAVALAKNDWVFSIDSDEVLTPVLLAAIENADFAKIENIYQISRQNHYRHHPIAGCGWAPDIIPRIYNRTFTQFSDRAVHEAIMLPGNAKVLTLSGELKHYSFAGADDLIRKMQQYSSLFADQFAYQKRSSATSAFIHGVGAFIKSYFLKQGFRYGSDGLTISASQAAGAFYKYAKLNERNQNLRVSLIITTYNRPDALQKVLYSVLAQRVLPSEILIADDGSRSDTADVIAAFAKETSISVKHIWQEDDGFRLAQSRNRAIAAATGEYIVMIDGDMVLHPHFIADHVQAACKKTFIQGSRVLLSPTKTQAMLNQSDKIESIHFWDKGIEKRLSALRCRCISQWVWNKKNQNFRALKGCNMGFFREDALNINGFNNDFIGWGREDSEFVARLYHAGCYRRNLKFAGIAYHLWHHEAERAALPQNDALLKNTLDNKLVRCENGLNAFIEPMKPTH